MIPYPSARQAALAAASAAVIATATTYYVYRTRRRNVQPDSRESSVTPEPEPQPHPQHDALPQSSTQNSHHPSESATRSSQPSPQVTPDLARPSAPSAANSDSNGTNSFAWAVFWDIENVPVPKAISAAHFVQALRKTLAAHRKQTHPDSILRIQAIANIRKTPVHLRNHLQANGVNLTHVESRGRKDAADKAIITEICLITREHATPFGICLISGDGDFSYPVARLAALGYATVVIAPIRHSFSTLLAAVPDAVIPLHAVLEGHDDPSMQPDVARREVARMRIPNHQTMRHTLPVPGPHLGPLAAPPRRADKRVMRKKRRDRIISTSSSLERDEDINRPWSSDDDRSARSAPYVTDFRIPDRPAQSRAFAPETEQDLPTRANRFERPYVGSSRLSPPRLVPPPNGQIQKGMRRRSYHLRDSTRQNRRQQVNGSANRPMNGSMGRMTPAVARDVDGMPASPSVLNDHNLDDHHGMENGPRVRFTGDTIIPGPDQRRRQAPRDVRRENGTRGGNSQNLRSAKSREPREVTSFTGRCNASEEAITREARWFYFGTRAFPFLVLLVVFILSLLFSSLRMAIVVLEAMQKV